MPPKTPDQKRARARMLAAARQSKRNSDLDGKAREKGYDGWSHVGSLVRGGVVQLPECPAEEREK